LFAGCDHVPATAIVTFIEEKKQITFFKM